MSTLWLQLAVLSLAAMLFVLIPLWRHRDRVAQSALEQRREKNRDVFSQRQQELAQDLQQGLVTAEEHAGLLAELQRAFLGDMEALERQHAVTGNWSGGRPLLLVLVLLIPLASLWIYRGQGSGEDLALPQLLAELRSAESDEQQLAVLGDLADFLQARFERRPDDLQNGYMLGTLNLELERHEAAIATFRRMLEQMEAGPDRATVLGQLAQAQYMQADSQVTSEVQATIDAALALNPNESGSVGILAIDAFLRQDFAAAIGYWRRQLAAAPPGSQQAETLRQRIAAVEAYIPDLADTQAPAAASGGAITLVIDVAPELAASVVPGMRLFVYARNPAMPMPILAQNLEAPQFPFTITLDNSMSMMGMTLESAPQLVVGVRLSTSGTATAQPGDLQTLSEPFVLTELAAPLSLVIDEVVP